MPDDLAGTDRQPRRARTPSRGACRRRPAPCPGSRRGRRGAPQARAGRVRRHGAHRQRPDDVGPKRRRHPCPLPRPVRARRTAARSTPCPTTICSPPGCPRAKIKTLRHLAAAELCRTARLRRTGRRCLPRPPSPGLSALPGIGRWSAEIYLLFCCGHPDILPAGDLALRKAAQIGARSCRNAVGKALARHRRNLVALARCRRRACSGATMP